MGDIFWLIGIYALFILIGAVFLSWLGVIIMGVLFPLVLLGAMLS